MVGDALQKPKTITAVHLRGVGGEHMQAHIRGGQNLHDITSDFIQRITNSRALTCNSDEIFVGCIRSLPLSKPNQCYKMV